MLNLKTIIPVGILPPKDIETLSVILNLDLFLKSLIFIQSGQQEAARAQQESNNPLS